MFPDSKLAFVSKFCASPDAMLHKRIVIEKRRALRLILVVVCVQTANDPKLSEPRGWRGPCVAGGEGGGPEAGAVTAARVRCSAWLGVGVRSRTNPKHDALPNFSARSAAPKACVAGEVDDHQTFDNCSPRREERV